MKHSSLSHVRLFDEVIIPTVANDFRSERVGGRNAFNRLINPSLEWWGKYRLGKLRRGTRRRDVDNKSGKSRCWVGGLKKKRGWRDLMIGGGGGSHLPKVLGPTEVALDRNRLRFNIRWVLPSACRRNFRLLIVVSTKQRDKQRLNVFWKHNLIVGWSLLN